MNYTNEEMLKRIEKAKRNRKKLTHITDKSMLSTEDKMKISLCKHFVQYANDKKMKLSEMSKMSRIPTSRLSEITNYKINKFTVDQLIKNLNILAEDAPRIREYLLFIEQAVDVPTLKVTETRKLTRGLREVTELGSKSAFLYA
jgi:predicted XRE-type DNA-binding protein